MKYFDENDLREVDQLLADIEHHAQDNDDLVRRLAEFRIRFNGNHAELASMEPKSDNYIDFVKRVHEEIIGQKHSASLEGLPELNPDHERDWPYPWGTKSSETVARFLGAYGFLLQVTKLPPHARILEVGCGVGSLTWNLCRMGFRVDALDPNELQCQIVRKATAGFPIQPNVIAMTLDQWLEAKTANYKYDAVIFFESFHHVIDHRECLRRLLASHVEFDSKIVLAAEPIFEKKNRLLPYPWGPRLDGESLRAMRRWGWLELGFTKSYIRSLFHELQLDFEWHSSSQALPLSQIVIGHKSANYVNRTRDSGARYPATLADGIDLSSDGMPTYVSSFDGLADAEPWGRWTLGNSVRLTMSHRLPKAFTLRLDLAAVFGPNVHKNLKVRVGNKTLKQRLEQIEQKNFYEFHFEHVGANEIEIIIPHPCRPKDIPQLNIEDPRRLGLGIKSIWISE